MVSDLYPWQREQWRRIVAARAAGRLPHALLLHGPEGIGKADFARHLADALVCPRPRDDGAPCRSCAACRLSEAGNHPDLHRVVPDQAGKMIKIDAVRELTAKSVLSAQEGGYRVFVLEPAEAMNRAAANALLKTLEEPASRSVMILVSSHPDRLPATIRSRCHAVKFTIPAGSSVRAWLGSRFEDAELDALLKVSGGAPLRALQAQQEGWIEEGRRLSGELQSLMRRQTNPLRVVEEWEKRPLTLVLGGLKRYLTDLIRLASGLPQAVIHDPELRADLKSLCDAVDLRSLHLLYGELLQLDRDASRNLNTQMMLEHIAHQWLLLTRPGVH